MPAELAPNPDDPFRASADPRLLYFDGRRREATARLISGLYRGEGLFLLTGRPGIGTTTLLRHLADQLHALDGIVLLSPHPVACGAATTLAEIVRSCETCLRLVVTPPDPLQLARRLQELADGDRSPVLLLDDAHLPNGDVLATIAALAALKAGERRLLSVVAAGAPGLSARFAEFAGESGSPADGHVIELQAMSEADARRLIHRRLHLAGAAAGAMLGDEAIAAAAHRGEGVPLAVLRLCRSALQTANSDAAAFSGSFAEPRAPATLADDVARAAESPQPASAAAPGPAAASTAGVDAVPGRIRFGADAARGVEPGQWQPRTRRRLPGKFSFALAGLVLLLFGAGWTLSDRRDTLTDTHAGIDPPGAPAADPVAARTWWQPGAPAATAEGPAAGGTPGGSSVAPHPADLQPAAGADRPPPPGPPAAAAVSTRPAPQDTAQTASPAKPRPRASAAPGQPAVGGDARSAGEPKGAARKREIEALLAEGDARLAEGEVDVARAAYERAYDKGSAEGAIRVAETFDPRSASARVATPSPAEAILWYKDAARRGDRQASAALAGLESWLEEAAGKGDRQAGRVLDAWRGATAEPAP